MYPDETAQAWAHLQELVNAGLGVTLSRPGKDRGAVMCRLSLGQTVMVEAERETTIAALRAVYSRWWPARDW